MDSCCIDKTSSAELSESINSMFDWYRDAVVCYVYPSEFVASEGSEFHFAISGARSRWFTRGWTLRELLAPENVVFYDQNWKDSGTKRSLAAAIISITGIDQKLISGETRVTDYSVAQKTSWASVRDTTRVEDMAYSLLGLFGISMPLLYGEGSRSFGRLQEEIIKTSTDQTIFAWRVGWVHTTEYDFDRGVLASSPADFRDSSRIVQAMSQSLDYTAYNITNKRLLIDLLVYEEEENSVGVLNCHEIEYPNIRLGILLEAFMFEAGNTSNISLQGRNQGDQNPPQGVLCQRVAPDLLRTIQLELVSKAPRVFLMVNPLWALPVSSASRFPLVDVSLEHDMGTSGFELARSSSLLAHESSRRLMCYTFRSSAGRLFGVTVQLDDSRRGAVRSRLEVVMAGEAALEDWATELVDSPLDQAEALIEDNEEWKLSAKIRHRIKENRRGQILSLILRVSLKANSEMGLDSPPAPECMA
ncbi:hypothetical protein PVAG01_05298 [Phlyctema vagabunda]|uniref:DUF8212 domain-containing protein n=1 Tax=Phlyctema vagabunda TaxID=108571 RepID=A0ABR4PJN5_9HELO